MPLEVITPALAASRVDVNLNSSVNHAEKFYLRQVADSAFRHVARDRVPIGDEIRVIIGELSELLEASDGAEDGRNCLVLRHPGGEVSLIEVYDGWVNLQTASGDPRSARETCRAVSDRLRFDDADPEQTPVTFWADDGASARRMRRRVDTPSWEAIAGNYADGARRGMKALLPLDETPPARLILWHGPPGTGKTHALRALARAWSPWCDVGFVADPEVLLGSSPNYLFNVARDAAGRRPSEARRRGKLIVLEDAGELMGLGAREDSGQGLSRLLNLTDGVLGQGLRVMVLITTNEPLSALHPAIMRPGRCLAEVCFDPLSAAEANAWLGAHDCPARVARPATLAELYALAAGDTLATMTRGPFGFSASAS